MSNDNELPKIKTTDSVSEIGSKKSKVGSSVSSASVKSKLAAKKAKLQVEAEVLKAMQELELQELQLK